MTDTLSTLGLVDDGEILLDGAALALAALDHPEVALAPYTALLDDLGARLGRRGDGAGGSRDRAHALAEVIAGEYGFEGDRTDYDDPANADLIRVIDRRRGLPVSLSILYVAAARRLGWAADALNMPGHVVVRIGHGTAPVLIDPFRGGRAIDAADLQGIVAAVDGIGATLLPEHLAPMSNRETLTRLLLNQATRAEAQGDIARARILYTRITIIAPGNVQGWWQKARLQLMGQDVAGARASLGALLETTRDPGLRARVTDTLERLAEGGR